MDSTPDQDTELPRFVKIIILITILVILLVIGIDIVAFAEAL